MKYLFPLGLLVTVATPLYSQAQTTIGVGIGTTSPRAHLHVENGNVLFSASGNVSGTPLPTLGEGRRLLWYADKAAFRAGYVGSYGVSYWDDTNVGLYSFATGYNPRASGQYSIAAGNGPIATGQGAMAIGSNAEATGDEALALGTSARSAGLASMVIGPSKARGAFAIAIGLQNSATGNFSVAIGKNASTANRQGAVVISDGCAGFSSDSLYATANNQINMRGCGGIRLFTNQNLSSGVTLSPGGGSWTSVSDRRRKENFLPVDAEQILRKVAALPLSEWNYKAQPTTQRHIGPMSQDFYAAFHLDGIGADTTINTIDIDGVNMAAIQALEKRTAALRRENELLRAQVRLLQDQVRGRDEQLLAQLRTLSARLSALEHTTATPRQELPQPIASK